MAWVGTAPRSPRHAPSIGQTPGLRANAPRMAGEGLLQFRFLRAAAWRGHCRRLLALLDTEAFNYTYQLKL